MLTPHSAFRSTGLAWAWGLAALAIAGPAHAASTKPVVDVHEEVIFVKVPDAPGVLLETTVFKPPGAGPFPLVVMNHGKAPVKPSSQPRARYPVLSEEFLRRGYAVVLPMRAGFSRSGGTYADGACELDVNARAQARDVAAAVSHFQQQAWVDAQHVMVIGQSHGGMVTMAYSERATPGVRLLVNFAGGLRANGGRCQYGWQEKMVRAFERFGTQARIPSLWFYGRNDSFFNAVFARQLLNQFDVGRTVADDTKAAARAPARLVATAPFGQDSHGMVEYSGAIALWWPELESEMRRRGMPVPSAGNTLPRGRMKLPGENLRTTW